MDASRNGPGTSTDPQKTKKMDQREFLNDDLLVKLLKEKNKKKTVKKLKERKLTRFMNEGDHYLSVVWQETVTVCNENNHYWKEKFIIKSLPPGELSMKYVNEEGVFKKEILMYTEILQQMKDEIENYEVGGDQLWPKYVGVHPNDLIVLEDLYGKGYSKVDRLKGLDYEHAMIVFQAIAKYHALTIPLKEKFEANESVFTNFLFGTYTTKRYKFFECKVSALYEVMMKWGPKWYKLAECLKNHTKEIYLNHVKKCKMNKNNFNVLNHGNLWTNNLLFKRCEFTNNVIGIRFVDYQMSHYNSYAIDLQYLLQSSVKPEIRRNHTEDLLIAYHSTLLKTARKLDLESTVIPSVSAIKAEMTDKLLTGIVFSIYLLDVMLVELDGAENFETLLQTGFNRFSKKVMSTLVYEERMKAVLEPFVDIDLMNL